MILICYFEVFRVVVQNLPSHLAKYPKDFSNFSSTAVAGVHGSLANTIQKLTDEVRDLFRRKFRVVDELLKIDTIAHVAHDT